MQQSGFSLCLEMDDVLHEVNWGRLVKAPLTRAEQGLQKSAGVNAVSGVNNNEELLLPINLRWERENVFPRTQKEYGESCWTRVVGLNTLEERKQGRWAINSLTSLFSIFHLLPWCFSAPPHSLKPVLAKKQGSLLLQSIKVSLPALQKGREGQKSDLKGQKKVSSKTSYYKVLWYFL